MQICSAMESFYTFSFPCYIYTSSKSTWYLDLTMTGLQADGPDLYI